MSFLQRLKNRGVRAGSKLQSSEEETALDKIVQLNVDVFQSDDLIVVYAQAAGADLSDIQVSIEGDADIVLIEGAGGWRVPISDTDCLSTWVKQEQLPVVLVVGIKLGCLSHAILTAESIIADGLKIVGWVANRVNPGTEHYAEIIAMLESRIPAPKLGEIPYVPTVKRQQIGKYINVDPLLASE